jgi:hypothetical protein
MLAPLSQAHRSLFWSQPNDFAADFVIEDPLAFDYLSQQVGYWLFGAITTRTSRAQYFAVVLYGLWLVETEVQGRTIGVDDTERKRLFERWERLWALAVHEYRGGDFAQSDPDTIRGQRGVTRAWRAGDDALPLDYKLIGRQSELGGLGAYMSVLRNDAASLVFPGTFRPTPLALPIIEAFWAEPDSGAKLAAYEQFARLALDPDRAKVPRKHGAINLYRLGKLSRLSVLTGRKRTEQQARLWNALFERATDDTLRFAQLVGDAARAGLEDPREILEAALANKLGLLEERQRDKLRVALAFGDVQQRLLTSFNLAFASALDAGWRVDVARAATAGFGTGAGASLRDACARLLDTPWAARFHDLPMHGAEFLRLVTTLRDASPTVALEALVLFHATIHRQRRHATPWLRVDNERLVVDVGAYGNRAQAEGTFPSFKLNVVRSLMTDLGRLP